MSIFASENNIDVDRKLNRKLLFCPIGVQWNANAQQCMSRVNVNLELVILPVARSKLVVVASFQRFVKLMSPVSISV